MSQKTPIGTFTDEHSPLMVDPAKFIEKVTYASWAKNYMASLPDGLVLIEFSENTNNASCVTVYKGMRYQRTYYKVKFRVGSDMLELANRFVADIKAEVG